MIDHLWQSTLCAAVAALVALSLRRGPAHVRYGVWLAASLKFLLPFATLTALGRQFAWRTASVTALAEPLPAALDMFVQPFATVGVTTAAAAASSQASLADWWWLAATVWAIGSMTVLVTWLRRWRRVATALAASTSITSGRELDILRRLERKTSARRPLRLRASDGSLEPGVCGIRRPVLLWPTTITARLTDSQIEGILAHEIAHVRRHDNLTAVLQMVVQTLFWFHPLVWWLGTRLVDERERACDQAAIRAGSEPGVYAEGILRTVQFYVESPLACVAGVTGSDLKRRIEDIMQGHTAVSLKPWQKAAVAVVALALVAVPLVRGSLAVTVVAAQAGEPPVLAFESASVKRNNTGEGRVSMRIMPGGVYEALNVTVRPRCWRGPGGTRCYSHADDDDDAGYEAARLAHVQRVDEHQRQNDRQRNDHGAACAIVAATDGPHRPGPNGTRRSLRLRLAVHARLATGRPWSGWRVAAKPREPAPCRPERDLHLHSRPGAARAAARILARSGGGARHRQRRTARRKLAISREPVPPDGVE